MSELIDPSPEKTVKAPESLVTHPSGWLKRALDEASYQAELLDQARRFVPDRSNRPHHQSWLAHALQDAKEMNEALNRARSGLPVIPVKMQIK